MPPPPFLGQLSRVAPSFRPDGLLTPSTPDEVYASTAYVLFLNGIVREQDVLNQSTLPRISMPNRNGFVADPRPDVVTPPTAAAPAPRKKSRA